MRVLRVLTRPNVGGPTRQAVALWHEHRALGVHTLLAVGTCEGDEPALDPSEAGIPELDAATAATGASGWCRVPGLARSVRPLRDVEARRALISLVRAFRPDVVHTHTTKAGFVGRSAAFAERVPCVAHTFHGLVMRDYWGRVVSRLALRVERLLAKRTDLLIAVSRSCRDELAALDVVADARVVLPAVDTRQFTPSRRGDARAALDLRDGERAIGFVGRAVPIKRLELFLEVARRLPEVVAFVFGGGRRAAEAAPALPNVRFRGTHRALHEVVPGFDLLVMPSRREGFPVAGVEAAASGVPTLGFDVPGVRDLVRMEGTGLLVPESEGAAGLVARVREFLAAGAPRLGMRGVALARRCSPSRAAGALRDAYQEVLERR